MMYGAKGLCSSNKGECSFFNQSNHFPKINSIWIGERNEGNGKYKGRNARNGIGVRVQGISVGMGEICVEMQKLWGNQVAGN